MPEGRIDRHRNIKTNPPGMGRRMGQAVGRKTQPPPSSPASKGTKQSPTQILARDVKAIQEALGDDDIRAALRIVDGRVSMASEQKALQCLPLLFPTAPSPRPSSRNPTPATPPTTKTNS